MRATFCAATMPPAPTMFSTNTTAPVPSAGARRTAMARASRSGPPPAANGTMSRTGRLGKSPARAGGCQGHQLELETTSIRHRQMSSGDRMARCGLAGAPCSESVLDADGGACDRGCRQPGLADADVREGVEQADVEVVRLQVPAS